MTGLTEIAAAFGLAMTGFKGIRLSGDQNAGYQEIRAQVIRITGYQDEILRRCLRMTPA